MIEERQGDKQIERNGKIRATIKRMFEDGEIGLVKLMRRMGALWTKTQAAKKARGQVRQQQAEEAAGDPRVQRDDQALRQVLQSVTDDVDPNAPEARQGRAWQDGRGGGRARPARGRGAGRGRGGRVQGTLRATCDRCGEEYARTYLRYHQRLCVGVMDHPWGEGRGILARGGRQGGGEPQVIGGAEAAARDPQDQPENIGDQPQEPQVQRGQRRSVGEAAAREHQVQHEQRQGGAEVDPQVQRGQRRGVGEAAAREPQVQHEQRQGGAEVDPQVQLDDEHELSDLEELDDLEDDDDEDILAEVEEMERTVFADVPEARGRGQKRTARTAMSVSSNDDDSQESPLFERPRRNLRRRSYWLEDHLLDTPPTPQQPSVPQPMGPGPSRQAPPTPPHQPSPLSFEVSTFTEGLVMDIQTRGENQSIFFNF